MFETGIEVGLRSQYHNVVEMRMVNVRVDPEEALEDYANDIDEVFWEPNTNLAREDFFVRQLVVHPCHKKVNVFRSAHLQRGLYVMSIRPKVFVLGSSAHSWASLGRAKLGEDSVQDVNFIVEFNRIHR